MSSQPNTRRRFLGHLALSCVGALGLHAWKVGSADDADTRLALRIVQAMGNVRVPQPRVGTRSISELLSTTFEPDTRAHLMQLDTTQLRQWLAARIVADYRKAALVHHHGWWLACSEAAILELGCMLDAHRMLLR